MPINVSWIKQVRDGKHLLDNGRPWLFPQWIFKYFVSSSFKLLAVEVSLGKLFHSLMYLVIKKYFLLFRLSFSVAFSYQITYTSLLAFVKLLPFPSYVYSFQISVHESIFPSLSIICPFPHLISFLLSHNPGSPLPGPLSDARPPKLKWSLQEQCPS